MITELLTAAAMFSTAWTVGPVTIAGRTYCAAALDRVTLVDAPNGDIFIHVRDTKVADNVEGWVQTDKWYGTTNGKGPKHLLQTVPLARVLNVYNKNKVIVAQVMIDLDTAKDMVVRMAACRIEKTEKQKNLLG